MMKKPNIFIVASGTGGHVFPALAVADILHKSSDILWIGTDAGIEHKHVKYPILTIQIAGFRHKNLLRQVTVIKNLFGAIVQSIKYIRQYHPVGVMCFGGYVSVPMGIAARLCNVPLVIHEQNAKIGLSNKILNLISTKTLTAYPNIVNSSKAIQVGNPLRSQFDRGFERANLTDDKRKLKLLILGGSLGAKYLNENLPNVINQLDNIAYVKHQIGSNTRVEDVAACYHTKRNNCVVEVVNFIEDVVAEYEKADFVICRAGALTVAEVSCTGVPALFIPLPHAVDNHQFYNAKPLVDCGASYLVEQGPNFEAEILKILQSLNVNQCYKMRNSNNNRHNNLYCLNIIDKIVQGCFKIK